MVRRGQPLALSKITPIDLAKEGVGGPYLVFVGASLDRVRPDGLAVSELPLNFLDAKPEYRNFFIVRVPGGFLKEVVGVLQLVHQPQNEVVVLLPPKYIRADVGLSRNVLDVLP